MTAARFLVIIVLLFPVGAPVAFASADFPVAKIQQYDRDSDGALTFSELVYLLAMEDPSLQEARSRGFSEEELLRQAQEWAVDAISATCDQLPCPPIEIASVPELLTALPRAAVAGGTKKSSRVGWKGLGFKRFISDPVDPRTWKTGRPFIFSYKRDGEAKEGVKEDQFSFLGGVQLYKNTWDFPSASTEPNRFFIWAPGIELDVDGSKPPSETSVTLASPFTLELFRPSDGFFSSHTLSLLPKFVTDRDFDRELWELAVSWAFASEAIRSSHFYYFGDSRDLSRLSRIAWIPSLAVAVGDIPDPAENEKLAVLAEAGSYLRIRGSVSFSYRPAASARLSLGLDYRQVYDFEQKFNRGYGEVSLQYDLNAAASVQLTAVYRKGRKEPDFAKKDEVLFGLGLFQ